MANNDLGTAFTHAAFPPDRKARSLVWNLYVLPAHILRLIAFLDLDAKRIISLRNAWVQVYLSTILWVIAIFVFSFFYIDAKG